MKKKDWKENIFWFTIWPCKYEINLFERRHKTTLNPRTIFDQKSTHHRIRTIGVLLLATEKNRTVWNLQNMNFLERKPTKRNVLENWSKLVKIGQIGQNWANWSNWSKFVKNWSSWSENWPTTEVEQLVFCFWGPKNKDRSVWNLQNMNFLEKKPTKRNVLESMWYFKWKISALEYFIICVKEE